MTHARLRGAAGLTTIETTTEIDAPPPAVWEILARPDGLAEWDDGLVRIGGISGRRDVAGASWWELRRLGRLPIWARWRVVAVEPGHRLDCLARMPPGGLATLTEIVEPRAGGTTTRHMRATYRLPLWGLGRWLERRLVGSQIVEGAERSDRNLKRLAELNGRAADPPSPEPRAPHEPPAAT